MFFIKATMHQLSLQDIAKSLPKCKQVGANKYVACCPAHNDNSPSLHITMGHNQDVIVHCFAGCSQDAVINSLKLLGLWPEKEKDDFDFKPKYNPFNDDRKLKAYDHAVLVLSIAEHDINLGKELTEADSECINKAKETVANLAQYFHWENLSGWEWRKLESRRFEIAKKA